MILYLYAGYVLGEEIGRSVEAKTTDHVKEFH